MAFPNSPTNGQSTTVDGINYTYSSSENSWTRQTLVISTDTTASSNTIILQGVDVTQNTRITVLEGVNVTQNTNITTVTGLAQAAFDKANTGVSTSTDDYARTAANTATNNIVILQGVNATQNTNITTVTGLAQAAFDKANTGVTSSIDDYARATSNTATNNIVILQGVNATQNTNITNATSLAQAAFNQANTGGLVSNTGNITVSTFTGDGTTVAFNLPVTPTNKDYTFITFDGATQLKASYSLSGNLITFSEAPLVGENIEIISFTNGVITSYDTLARDIANTATNNITILQGVNATQNTNISNKFNSSGGTITGSVTIAGNNDLIVTGNLIITGNVSSQNVQQLAVADPLLILGIGNYVSDTKDIGFAAHYNDGSNAHAGIIRDSSTKEFYVFQGYTPEVDATNNVDITNATFSTANINANYVKGNLIATTAVVGGVNLLDVNASQNTRISSANSTASAAYAKANTNISSDLTLTVTNSGSGAYVIGGVSNPSVTLYRGVTYYFSINASGHPFHIQTVSGAYSSGNLYTSGVTGAGTQVGTLTFTVPLDAPSNLYYVCQFHSSMNGSFLIENLISTVNTQNTNITILQGVNTTQNTNITTVTGLAQAAFDKANTGVSTSTDDYARTAANTATNNITILQGVNTTQNTNITFATNLAQAAYNQANTGGSGGLVSNTGIITVDTFVGNGSNVAFTLSVTPITKNYTSITIEGTSQLKDSYSLSGNIITFSEAPLNGDNVEVVSFTSGLIESQDNVARIIANTATSNIAILQGVDVTQNTRLSVVEGGLISANANTVYLNSLITTNNTRISVVEGVDTTQNTRISSVDNTATAAYAKANAAFDKANTGGSGSSSGYLANAVIIANTTGYLTNTSSIQYFTSNNNLVLTGNVIAGGVRSTTSSSPPSSPTPGDIWYNTSDDVLYRYTYDGVNNYWVDIITPTITSNTTSSIDVVNPFLLMGA